MVPPLDANVVPTWIVYRQPRRLPEIRYLGSLKVEADSSGTVEQIQGRTPQIRDAIVPLTSLDSATARSPSGKTQIARGYHGTHQRVVAEEISQVDLLHGICHSVTGDSPRGIAWTRYSLKKKSTPLMGGVMSGEVTRRSEG